MQEEPSGKPLLAKLTFTYKNDSGCMHKSRAKSWFDTTIIYRQYFSNTTHVKS